MAARNGRGNAGCADVRSDGLNRGSPESDGPMTGYELRNRERADRDAGDIYRDGGLPACAQIEPRESAIILNADDWGRDRATTGRILDCIRAGVVSSTSAMVWMEDSERAAEQARAYGVDTGLHLNFSSEFSGPRCPARVKEHQARIRRFLMSHRFAPALYHPGLRASFEYVVRAQSDEYERLYGTAPGRIDGHHHMHLCANVLSGKMLPEGAIVRRDFSFQPGEKGGLNRAYRNWRDRKLARRHRVADYFFSLVPVKPPGRLKSIFALGAYANVEVETHPIDDEDYTFLRGKEFDRFAGEVSVTRGYVLRSFGAREGRTGASEGCAGRAAS